MRRRPTVPRRLALVLIALALLVPAAAQGAPTESQVKEKLGGLGLRFIANDGQIDARVAYYAPTFAGTLFVTGGGELVYGLPARSVESPDAPEALRGKGRAHAGPGWSLVETLRGGTVRPVGQERSATAVSTFRGNDPGRWRRELPTYDQLALGEVWPGITVALTARGLGIEKVFTVSPGASVDRIRVHVAGARALSVSPNGALVARTEVGDVTFTAPVAYQERDGVRRAVPVAYRLEAEEYGFSVGAYDLALPLVIDPLLRATYLGGSDCDCYIRLAIHPISGDVYVAGTTGSTDFPGTTFGAFPTKSDNVDVFVARLNADLTSLLQATYLGGTDDDSAAALAIHPVSGDVYVAGLTFSTDFPGTSGGAQDTNQGSGDAFVARLNAGLTSLVQATYLGGGDADAASGLLALAIHPVSGEVYVAGGTLSTDFPGTLGGAQDTPGGDADAFVARLNAALTSLLQATYLGGTGAECAAGLAIHPVSGDVYVAGCTDSTDFPNTTGGAQDAPGGDADAFAARLNAALTSLLQATYLGGTGVESVTALAIHPTSGDVYVAGGTGSTDFPGTPGGAQPAIADELFGDGFAARLNADLTSLIQATYLGGTLDDIVFALTIHPTSGDVYVAGSSRSVDFPGTAGGAQPAIADGFFGDGFVARLNVGLTSLIQATYLGGTLLDSADDVAIHPISGEVYVAGTTSSTNFPGTTAGAQPASGGDADAFVARLTADLAGPPDLTIAKAHSGTFIQDQVGASYLITISNAGGSATSGTVTVMDTLPAGLTATALSGVGWSCTLGTLTCTRADALAKSSSYPAITVTVTVAAGAPLLVINTAIVSGGGEINLANNTATDVTTVFIDFVDVPSTDPFLPWIEALAAAGITGGCGTAPARYCPDASVTRGEMAVFVLRGIHGAAYDPPAATGTVFADVPIAHPFATWIEQLAHEGIVSGCATSPARYCPDTGVTRAQMAVLLLRAEHGAGYDPPAATGTMFTDVLITHPFAKWIEQLAREGVTGGCGPTTFCPDATTTRAQMAVFIVRTFGLLI